MGEYRTPFGWGLPGVETYIREQIDQAPAHLGPRVVTRCSLPGQKKSTA